MVTRGRAGVMAPGLSGSRTCPFSTLPPYFTTLPPLVLLGQKLLALLDKEGLALGRSQSSEGEKMSI